jgi:hypothetical protein
MNYPEDRKGTIAVVHAQPIALTCRISPAGFSGERIVEVVQANNEILRGLAPRDYCWNANRKPLAVDEPHNEEIPGYVAARLLERLQPDKAVVTVPDGAVFVVATSIISERPPVEIAPHVPV